MAVSHCWTEGLNISAHLYPFIVIVGKLNCFPEGKIIPQKTIRVLSTRANSTESRHPPPSATCTKALIIVNKAIKAVLLHRPMSQLPSISFWPQYIKKFPPNSFLNKGIANKCIYSSAYTLQIFPSNDCGCLRAQALTHWFALAPRAQVSLQNRPQT